ncbi:MAG: ABC transporter ATP-binding protein [Cellvibrionales bacterium TMED21]|nr:ABC transporter ATP-binding protein [Halieaceae bacterium]OUT67635.1 MAG: ABC transporter ATP-binding protein [Cellvibrionales bacterium TMED21]|tara:strand:- start:3749 stop:5440 length:1692 start_codon:yes stop_codon:yes gene_type:complete
MRLIAASVALVFTAIAQLSLGVGIQVLVDEGFAAQSQAGLRKAVLFMVSVGFAMACGSFIRFYLVSWLGERVSADLRTAVFSNLLRIQPSFYEKNHAGEIMSRLTTDTTLLQTLIGSSVSLAARSALTLLGALIMMSITNLKLTLIMLVGVPLTLIPVLVLGRRVRSLSNRSQASIANVGSRAGEVLQSIKIVQSFQREQMERDNFDVDVETAFRIAKKRIQQRAFLMACAIFLFLGGMVGMMWAGGQDVLAGRMSGGDLGAFVFYAVMLGSAFATLSEVWGDLQRAAGASERLVELMHMESNILDIGQSPVPQGQAIVAESLEFFYPSRPANPALSEFSLVIPPGKTLALVGPSGAGKSTLFELLQRFHDPSAGSLSYGGVALTDIPLDDWRAKTALVPQAPILFTGDVAYNIGYGTEDASQADIEAAAKAAYADEFIRQLPDGYQSELGAQGVQLSGGQRQRIALARAIIHNPEILLLDEATSALDTESEHYVQLALQDITRDRTTIVIAHRLSTIINADAIAVIDGGRVIDVGTHAELIDRCELYARLASMQFKNEEKVA